MDSMRLVFKRILESGSTFIDVTSTVTSFNSTVANMIVFGNDSLPEVINSKFVKSSISAKTKIWKEMHGHAFLNDLSILQLFRFILHLLAKQNFAVIINF